MSELGSVLEDNDIAKNRATRTSGNSEPNAANWTINKIKNEHLTFEKTKNLVSI